MKRLNKNIIVLFIFVFIFITIPFVIKLSYALNDLTSTEYEIKNNTIYAVPTTYNFRVEELLSKLTSSSTLNVLNTSNEELKVGDSVSTGYTLKQDDNTYNIVVLGDVTSDGLINLGDVAKLYNSYKGKTELNDIESKAGDTASNNKIDLSDVSKLYNYFKGKSAFSYFDNNMISIDNIVSNAESYYELNKTSNKLGTNLINELSSNNSTNDQVVITKTGGIEVAIEKSNKCYRKSALSNYVEVTDEDYCGINVDRFYSNNGSLHISGNKILNEDNKEVILRGFVSGTSTRINTEWDTWYTDETFKTIRKWGANYFRFTIKPEQYVDNSNYAEKLFKYIDYALDNDLYVLITWMGNSDYEAYTNQAKEFFNTMSLRYKDNNNVLYEVCNEPFQSKWNNIKAYAEEIIPIIRNNDSDAIIVVPVSYHFQDEDDSLKTLLTNPIDDNNVIYSMHMYVAHSLNSTTLLDIEEVLKNNKPIMISEWGTTASDGSSGFYEGNSSIWLDFLEDRHISWLNFNLSDVYWNNVNYDSSVVKMGEWNSNLDESILSDSGKYIKNALLHGVNPSKPAVMTRYDGYGIWDEEIIPNIHNVSFKLNSYIPDHFDQEFDLSLNVGSGIVKGYLDGNNLYIVSTTNKLYAPSTLKNFFKGFTSLESIDLTNLSTEEVISLENTFNNCKNLSYIVLGDLNTSNVSNMSQTFATCTSLTELDLSSLDFSKVSNINFLFSWTSNLSTLKLPNLNTELIDKNTEVFYNVSNQASELNIYTKNTDYINSLINSSTINMNNINVINY